MGSISTGLRDHLGTPSAAVFCPAARTSSFLLYGGGGGDGGAYLLTKQFWLPQNNLCVNLDLGKAYTLCAVVFTAHLSINDVTLVAIELGGRCHRLGGAQKRGVTRAAASSKRRRHQNGGASEAGGAIKAAASHRLAAPSERGRRRGRRRHQSDGAIRAALDNQRETKKASAPTGWRRQCSAMTFGWRRRR